MRTLFLISIAIVLFTAGCKKEDEWQTVSITGNYTNTPDPAGGFFTLTLPDGTTFQSPKKYFVSGSDNVVGTIDAAKSTLTVESITPSTRFLGFDLVYHIVIYNSDGDQVHFNGTAQSYADFTGIGWVHYTDGTGKFEGISGWEDFTLTTNPLTGVHTIVATGEATYLK
ncbi:MAG TPA: hypothetical protein DCF33_17570 [Saprospirales bacterium]|nr:hypothetical protein [Saprospirales bacterium]